MSEVTVQAVGVHIRDQLREQGVRLPGHATASLERTRQATVQLFLAGVISSFESNRIDKRYEKLVRLVVKRYRRNRDAKKVKS